MKRLQQYSPGVRGWSTGAWLADKGYQETFRDNGNVLHLDKGLSGMTVFLKRINYALDLFISLYVNLISHRDRTLVNA